MIYKLLVMLNKKFLLTNSVLLDQNNRPLPGAIDFINSLTQQKIPFAILTNQSTKTRAQIAEEYMRYGFDYIIPSMFYTTTMAAIDEIVQYDYKKNKATYVGGRGIKEVMDLAGFYVSDFKNDWIFVGRVNQMSGEDFTYALEMIMEGAVIVETDSTKLYYVDNEPRLGAGSYVRMLEYATNTKAFRVDFPSTTILKQALRYLQATPSDAVLVSSDLNKEIKSGNTFGIDTIFVTTAMDETQNILMQSIHPTYVIESLVGLIQE